MSKKSYAKGYTHTGVYSTTQNIVDVGENEIVTIKSLYLFLYSGDAADVVEAWFGQSYTGCQTFGIACSGTAQKQVEVTLYPNVKVLPGERVCITPALVNAASVFTYTITYEVEVKNNANSPIFKQDNDGCSLLDKMLDRC